MPSRLHVFGKVLEDGGWEAEHKSDASVPHTASQDATGMAGFQVQGLISDGDFQSPFC